MGWQVLNLGCFIYFSLVLFFIVGEPNYFGFSAYSVMFVKYSDCHSYSLDFSPIVVINHTSKLRGGIFKFSLHKLIGMMSGPAAKNQIGLILENYIDA